MAEVHGIEEPSQAGTESPVEDDIWDDSDDRVIPETTRIRRDHHNTGYIDGITDSKEAALQIGFDKGYPVGAEIGLQIGRIIGELQGLGLSDLEKAATKELAADQIFSSRYWGNSLEKKWEGEIHPLVLKWQQLVKQME